MRLVERVTDSGLVLRESGDGAAVARALRDHDSELSLRVDQYGLWRVYVRDTIVCSWADRDGNPLPLSMGLVDKVKQLDRNTASKAPDPDELNELNQAEIRRQHQRDLEAIESEHLPAIRTNRLSVQIPRDL